MSLSEQIQRVDGSQNDILKAIAKSYGLSVDGMKIDELSETVKTSPKFAQDSLLSADTAALFGLGADAVPDEALAVAGKGIFKVGDIKSTIAQVDDSWLYCNGQYVDKEQYPELNNVLVEAGSAAPKNKVSPTPWPTSGFLYPINGMVYVDGVYFIGTCYTSGGTNSIYYSKNKKTWEKLPVSMPEYVNGKTWSSRLSVMHINDLWVVVVPIALDRTAEGSYVSYSQSLESGWSGYYVNMFIAKMEYIDGNYIAVGGVYSSGNRVPRYAFTSNIKGGLQPIAISGYTESGNIVVHDVVKDRNGDIVLLMGIDGTTKLVVFQAGISGGYQIKSFSYAGGGYTYPTKVIVLDDDKYLFMGSGIYILTGKSLNEISSNSPLGSISSPRDITKVGDYFVACGMSQNSAQKSVPSISISKDGLSWSNPIELFKKVSASNYENQSCSGAAGSSIEDMVLVGPNVSGAAIVYNVSAITPTIADSNGARSYIKGKR